MIISKTPYRISFFGGGTDYPDWYTKNGGKVISTSIDKYCYISCRNLPQFFEHKYRFVYSKIEHTKKINQIIHPAARAVLEEMKIDSGLEIHHDGDLPARSGLGSSSSFTVGMINVLTALQGKRISKESLAKEAIRIEQDVIKENVGSQDQIAVSYGGFNKIKFNTNGSFEVEQLIIPDDKYSSLQDHLVLFFTGISRFSSDIAGSIIEDLDLMEKKFKVIETYVDKGLEIITNKDKSILEFGDLLNEYWHIKKSLNKNISNSTIDEIYAKAIKSGALGGKLLGSGGGGFFLFFIEPKNLKTLIKNLSPLVYVPIKFDKNGSRIVLYEPTGF
tara:strand:- start:62 stop:1057 length:996 start_codon:yes stop_codon:yes gene_type:complete